ncbi:DUF6603 domain-containing protein [Catellatospora coxensis]|uniref:DUF6603 domain-containing protein n=1 Tax=Catellatospora coxensis TaxID=310354 RepID=A0A8J3KTA9_9ACTN|nr:DUF6603 domain-containing protein [Catellatospora coxensis]GIG06725.1 hypothetical protein Cco03nite_34250 [Catellatospora coxensis]
MAAAHLMPAVVAFAHDRLTRLLADASGELLATVAPAAATTPALLSGLDQDLAAARGELARAGGEPAAAVRCLATALGHVADACRRIAAAVPQAGTAEQLLAAAVTDAVGDCGGLAAQLGLGGPWRWTVSGTVLAASAHAESTVDLGPVVLRHPELTVRLDWAAAALSVRLSADAVLRLAADPLVAALATGGANAVTHVSVGVDAEHGLTVGEGTDQRVRLPATVETSAVALRDLTLAVPDRDIELTAELAGTLGPVAVTVSGAGAVLSVDPAAATALTAATRLPDGAGLAVNAGVVRGGGHLDRHDSGYRGTLALSIGPVQVTAVGLIGTEPGFSLVLLFSTDFAAPIQVGFGFTLDAVGGLLAVARTVSSDAMIAGIHDGTADALLFPDQLDRVDTALLERIFPARGGAVAVGPAFQLGWGTPVSFLTAKVGIVVALPAPKLMLLGAVRVAVPSPALPIVDLRAAVYGETTPERALVLVSLTGSRLAGFGLSGDLGMLFSYGAQPRFAISAGGFHPGYPAPPELSGMRRLAVDISPPALLSLRAEAYVALTGNAFMLGARVEATIDFEVAAAHGHLSFDALVQWAPFHFEVGIRAGIAVSVLGETFAGIALSLHLQGPGRWIAHGTATLELAFLPDIDLEVGPKEWGADPDEQPKAASPLEVLRDELDHAASWQVLPPATAQDLVVLRDAAPDADALFAHPLGGVGVRQRAVPLDVPIAHLGGRPVREHLLALGDPAVGGMRPQRVVAVTELFAPGLYLALTEDQKLSTPAYARYRCGTTAEGFHATPHGPVRHTEYRWETVYPHRADLAAQRHDGAHVHPPAGQVLAAGPAGRSRAAADPYQVTGRPLRLQEDVR